MTKPASERQRQWRRRRACGVRLLQIPVCEHDLASAMIESGLLSVGEALDTASLARGAGAVLSEWSIRWNQQKP